MVMEKVTVHARPSETVTAPSGWKCFHKPIKFIKGLFYGDIKQSVINTVPWAKELLSSDTHGAARDWATPAYRGAIIPLQSYFKPWLVRVGE